MRDLQTRLVGLVEALLLTTVATILGLLVGEVISYLVLR